MTDASEVLTTSIIREKIAQMVAALTSTTLLGSLSQNAVVFISIYYCVLNYVTHDRTNPNQIN
jgi:hypothetical protein